MQHKEREMFGKSKDENDRVSHPAQQLPRPAAMHAGEQASTDQAIRLQRDRETERLVSLRILDPVILYILGGGLIILALGMAAIDFT
jgi:hypothetical protein